MATTSLWRIRGPVGKVLNYAQNAEKTSCEDTVVPAETAEAGNIGKLIEYAEREGATEHQRYVSGINCNPDTASGEMNAVKTFFGKTGGTIAYHGYQSFAEGEVTPEQAHEIGKKLANELWGERYQVVVATHLDKQSHIHNHFVINTVSFVDGIKFFRSENDYKQMQEVSGRLCKEAGLSVIKASEGKGKHYAEWKAEHDGEPTVRDGIRKDIDDAVSQSMTWSHFAGVMQQKGYRFKLYRQDGELLAHPGIIPPGSEKAFRLDGLGERYTLDAISDRIIENTGPALLFKESETIHRKAKTVRPKKKLHGLYALYIRYCYELHIIVKQPRNKPLHMELRADAVKLKKLDEQTRFLARYGITNLDELAAHKAAAEKLHEALREEQHITANSRKALKRRGDEEGLKALDKERASRTAKLRELFREEKLCDEIAARSEEIRQRLELAGEYRKEISEDEYIRRCGRAGRENESGSDRGRG